MNLNKFTEKAQEADPEAAARLRFGTLRDLESSWANQAHPPA